MALPLILPSGSSLKSIAGRLEEGGVIEDRWLFMVAARLSRKARSLKAGEYRFNAAISAGEVMAKIAAGETVIRRLTIPEGLLGSQVLELVAQADGLSGRVPETVREGTLQPETYHYKYGDSRAELVGRMRASMGRNLAELWRARAKDLPLKDSFEALILASIVEKETGLAVERPHIAGVFVNRLKRGMRLQSDPTVAYGITGGAALLDRPLTRKDIETFSVFNTYRIDGLPPYPIANPGLASLRAVLNPLATDDLYFVADGTGGHAFAKTLREHIRNVRKWRKINNKK